MISLSVVLVALFLGAVGVVLIAAFPDGRLSHAGIALVGASLGTLLGLAGTVVRDRLRRKQQQHKIDLQLKQSLSGALQTLTESGRAEVLQPLTGVRALADELSREYLSRGLYYSDWQVNIDFAFLSPAVHVPEDCSQFMSFEATYEFLVHNPGTASVSYPLRVTYFDLHRVQAGVPHVTALRFVPLDEHHQEQPGRAIELKGYQVDNTTTQSDERRELSTFRDFNLDPGAVCKLRVKVSGFEPIAQGHFNLQSRRPAINMVVRLTFPDADFKPTIYFAHPRPTDVDVCSHQFIAPNVVEAKIHGPFLPYQGVICTWSHGPRITHEPMPEVARS